MRRLRHSRHALTLAAVALSGAVAGLYGGTEVDAQNGTPPLPTVVDPNLIVQPVASNLELPITMAFLGDDDFFVLEKASGRVWRVAGGAAALVLDLPVNSASERGLLGIALHPDFPDNSGVYLFWSESTTGADSTGVAEVPLLGNRVDRFEWDGSTLTLGAPIARFRALQADEGQPMRGNHDGGVLRFGPDGKLYIVVGDVGRRGWMQNLMCGPVPECDGAVMADDQFGGPMPDDAHLTGVIVRVNDDGTAPEDNPFVEFGSQIGGEVGVNLQKVFAYGLRNSFGMDFDPVSGVLWLEQNGDDSFSELDRVLPGMNGGWIQVMGPIDRIAEFKAIETSAQFQGLQQIRWPPSLIADSPDEASERLVMLPGAHYSDPELSWRFEVAPAGIGFLHGPALGPQYENDLFIGGARATLEGGHLFHINLTGNRRMVGVDDPALEDRVADNFGKFDITESETLLFGRGFGVATDIRTGPDGHLYIVSLSHGMIYKILRP